MTNHTAESWERDSRLDRQEFSLPLRNLEFKRKRDHEVDCVLSHTASQYSETKTVTEV